MKTVGFVRDISDAINAINLSQKQRDVSLHISVDEREAVIKTMLAYGFQVEPYEYKKDVPWDDKMFNWLRFAIFKLYQSQEHNLVADLLRAVLYKYRTKKKKRVLEKVGILVGPDRAPTAINPDKYPIEIPDH